MSDGNRHNHHNLPTLLVGGRDLIRGGRHLRISDDRPVTNLFLTVLDKLGVPADAIGDSTGRVEHLSGV